MENRLSHRGKIRIILYIAVAFAVLFCAFAISSRKVSTLTRQLNASSERSLASLEDCLSSINTNLTKGIYANTSAMFGSIAVSLTRDASNAKNALASLPLSDTQLDNILKFLSQVGSFVSTLNRKVALGETPTQSEREEMKKLTEISQTLLNELANVTQGIEDGSISFSQAGETLAASTDQILLLETAMSDAEQTLFDYPTLIYDGPFSDHILSRSPTLLNGKSEVSKEEAMKTAADFIGTDITAMHFDGEAAGTIPAFLFSVDSVSISVSKSGGEIVYLLGSSNVGESVLTSEQAIKRAYEFLSSKGYEDMKDSYYSTLDGICTVNFAYMQEETVCYPDLIKVSVSLETGNIISFDAKGYIMNHTQRNIPKNIISSEEAKNSLSDSLSVISTKLAVIPTDYQTEQTAYEFHCKSADGQELLVYIDAVTGKEDDILILLYSDGGILTK